MDELQAVVDRYRADEVIDDAPAPSASTVLLHGFPTPEASRCDRPRRPIRPPPLPAAARLRWLPTGLLMPVYVLVMTDRGFTLTTIGIAAAAQGVMVLLLELPTGGLADALGRRRVLLTATAVDIAAVAVFAFWARSLSCCWSSRR